MSKQQQLGNIMYRLNNFDKVVSVAVWWPYGYHKLSYFRSQGTDISIWVFVLIEGTLRAPVFCKAISVKTWPLHPFDKDNHMHFQ